MISSQLGRSRRIRYRFLDSVTTYLPAVDEYYLQCGDVKLRLVPLACLNGGRFQMYAVTGRRLVCMIAELVSERHESPVLVGGRLTASRMDLSSGLRGWLEAIPRRLSP